MACFELYQLFGTIITWLLISRSGYRRANLLSDPHNVLAAPCARRALVDETIRRGISLVVRIQRIQLSVAVTAAADIFISLQHTTGWINIALTRSVTNRKLKYIDLR